MFFLYALYPLIIMLANFHRKYFFRLLAALAFCLCAFSGVKAQQWEKIGWEGGQGPKILAQLGNTIYGLANFAYYKSTDLGKTWTIFSAGLPNDSNLRFTNYHDYLISGIYSDSSKTGFFYCKEQDNKWSFQNLNQMGNEKIFFWSGDSIFTFVGNGSGQQDGYYFTLNAGKSWMRRMSIASPPYYYPISLKNSFFISSYLGTYRTDDFGITWKPIHAPDNDTLGFSGENMYSINDSILIRFYYNDLHYTGLYRSSDLGDSWQKINDFAGKYLTEIDQIKSIGKKTFLIYNVDSKHLKQYQSDDLGLNWSQLIFPDTLLQLIDLFGTDNNYILNTTWGFFVTDSTYSNLSPFVTGSKGVMANSRALVGVIGTKLFALLDAKKNLSYDSLLVSTDNGSTWTEKLFSDSDKISTLRWIQKGNIYYSLGFHNDTNMCIFKTADEGATWSIAAHIPSKELFAQYFIDGDTIIGRRSQDFLITIDNAKSWVAYNFPQKNTPYPASLSMYRRNGVSLILNNQTGELSSSHDFVNWTTDNPFISPPFDTLTVEYVYGPYIFGDRWFRFCQFTVYYSRLLYRTENNLAQDTSFGFANANSNHVFFPVCDDNNILFAPYYTALFYSRDSGSNWKQLGDNVPYSTDVFIGTEYIFFTGPNELWRMPKSALPTLKAQEQKSISTLSLTCFPNPATTSTRISYSIPQHSDVLIEAFDVMGRSVALIASGARDAGDYEALWDTNLLPAGSYIIRLTAGGESVSKVVEVVR
jgi:hypothetical protein